VAPIAPVGDRSIPLEDDSGTIATTPRRALIVALAAAVAAGEARSDKRLVEIASETLMALFDSARGQLD